MALITNTGKEIKVTPNHSKRTFTLRVDGTKYRTLKFNKKEFEEARILWTADDWQQFLKTDEYYKV